MSGERLRLAFKAWTTRIGTALEYRVEQHAAKLRDKLAALRAAETGSETDSVPARPR